MIAAIAPPFPVLDVTLRGMEESVGPMLALLDTGADATIAPTDLLDQISAPESGWAVLRSPLGDGVPVQRYLISI